MAYNGDSKKIVSSSFLYTTLQTFYTKIKGLLDKKSDKTHTHSPSDLMYSSTIDLSASTYDQDTYYPVVGNDLPYTGFCRIKVAVQLNSGTKPKWSNHDRGFTCNMDLLVKAGGWGTTGSQSMALDYSYAWTDTNPCGFYQLTNDSFPVLWLRGGGKYFVWHDYKATWSIKTSEYTSSNTTIAPATTNPGIQFIYSEIYAHLKGDADSVDGLHSWDLQRVMICAEPNSNVLEYAETYPTFHNHGTFFTYRVYNGYGEPFAENAVGSGDYYYYANKIDTSWITIIAVDVRTSNMYMRSKNNGVWSAVWRNVSDDGNARTSLSTSNLSSTGFGNGTLTYLQTANDFYDNTGWCHYIIGNHQDGATYYNYTIGLPFWDVPIYQRQTGNTSAKSGWHKFYTTENITYGTSALTPGSSGLKTGHIYLQYE